MVISRTIWIVRTFILSIFQVRKISRRLVQLTIASSRSYTTSRKVSSGIRVATVPVSREICRQLIGFSSTVLRKRNANPFRVTRANDSLGSYIIRRIDWKRNIKKEREEKNKTTMKLTINPSNISFPNLR